MEPEQLFSEAYKTEGCLKTLHRDEWNSSACAEMLRDTQVLMFTISIQIIFSFL